MNATWCSYEKHPSSRQHTSPHKEAVVFYSSYTCSQIQFPSYSIFLFLTFLHDWLERRRCPEGKCVVNSLMRRNSRRVSDVTHKTFQLTFNTAWQGGTQMLYFWDLLQIHIQLSSSKSVLKDCKWFSRSNMVAHVLEHKRNIRGRCSVGNKLNTWEVPTQRPLRDQRGGAHSAV